VCDLAGGDQLVDDRLGDVDRDGKAQPDVATFEPGRAATAEGIPTSSPLQLTMAPPLLPGLMAASVWMASARSALCDVPPPGTWIVRASALTSRS
jgi:hypothetical protein